MVYRSFKYFYVFLCLSVHFFKDLFFRRLWREVTAGLKSGDIEAATEAKCSLEHRQRTEAKQRKEDDVKWENRMFSPVGENWYFTQSLGSRI